MHQPDLKPIVIVLKKLLHAHDLNQPYHGGLSSYSLVLMTSAFLRMFNEIKSISKNLLEFLNYFGSYFDPSTTIIENQ
jgi:non-canonical poly(A) RNA polymerase PAPD5/7